MIIEMNVPLPSHLQQRLARGELTRVNEDGSDYVEPVKPSDLASGTPARPAANALKDEWVAYLINAYGIDPERAEAMTKQDMIDMVSQLEG